MRYFTADVPEHLDEDELDLVWLQGPMFWLPIKRVVKNRKKYKYNGWLLIRCTPLKGKV